jgi:hypothetical protein
LKSLARAPETAEVGLEAALMLMVSAYSDEIPTNILPTKKGSPKPLLDWSLHELVIVARLEHLNFRSI